MPIYEQSYRTFDGEVVRRFRWWIVVRQEVRLLWKTRLFRVLLFPTVVHTTVMVLWILLVDIATSAGVQSLQAIPELAQTAAGFDVEPDLFRVFIQRQGFLVFLMIVAAGSGFIGSDFKYNLVEVYFSKPLSWMDYVMGKLVTLVLVGFTASLFPALLLILLHFIFDPESIELKVGDSAQVKIMLLDKDGNLANIPFFTYGSPRRSLTAKSSTAICSTRT